MATFTVTNLLDAGAGSLRDFINQANAMAGADTIEFDPGLSGTISLIGGELLITDSLSILGPGADLLTIDAQQMSRVFNIDDGNDFSNPLNVTLDSLTTTGGLTEGGFEASGGGIRSFENLTVSNSIVSGNSTSGDSAQGGGIFNGYNRLRVIDSKVSNNSTSGSFSSGGGIGSNSFYTASVDVINSTISGNSTTGDVARGGGIYGGRSSISLSSSTVSGNSTSGDAADGGGISIQGRSLTISNSTISGNSTSGGGAEGGGIYHSAGRLNISNSTVSGNSTTAGDSEGGGIYAVGVFFYGVTLNTNNSIIAGNTVNAAGADIFLNSSSFLADDDDIFSSASGTGNIIGAGDDTGNGAFNIADGVNGNKVGTTASPVDPLLGPLQNNGGPTFTQSPLPGSPAIDMGANPQSLLTDQRGLPREVGQADIGAVEVQPVTEPPTAVPEPTSVISLALMGVVMGRKVLQKRSS
ncbi:MAG: choice-of-anchor Q domain-containing protein [Cyanobacteria bacterium J06632_22]